MNIVLFYVFFTGSSSYSAYNTLDITYRVMNIFLSKHYNPMGLPFVNLKIYDKLQEMFLSNNKVQRVNIRAFNLLQ